MKYIISESKLNDIIYKYLDLNLKGLNKRKPRTFKGKLFTYPDDIYGILGYENDGTLHIYYRLVDDISSNFGLDEYGSESIIGRWFSDRYQLEVTNTKESLKLEIMR